MELIRSMLHSRNVRAKFGAEAVQTVVYVLNRTSSFTRPRTTLYEAWWGIKPSLNHLRIFGCSAFIHAEKHTRTKLQPKSRPGMFVGYSDESKAYRVWDFTKDKIVITRDIICNEHEPLVFSSPANTTHQQPVTVIFNPRSTLSLPQLSTVPRSVPSFQPAAFSHPAQLPATVPASDMVPALDTLPAENNHIDNLNQEDDPLD